MGIKRKSVVIDGQRFEFSITPQQMANAVSKVDGYSLEEKIQRFDDVFAAQPAVLGAAVQLPSHGVDVRTADHAFHVLLVLFEVFSMHVPNLPKIAPETVHKAFGEVTSSQRFYDGETVAEANQPLVIWMKRYKEQAVYAFVLSYLTSQLNKPTREQELVRTCCMAMTNAFLMTYEASQ